MESFGIFAIRVLPLVFTSDGSWRNSEPADAVGRRGAEVCGGLLPPSLAGEDQELPLVSRQWDEIIMKDVWGNTRGRKKLEAKFVAFPYRKSCILDNKQEFSGIELAES